MNRSKNIIVVCEGASEWMYLQRLNSFLSSQPFPEGWLDVPIRFMVNRRRQVLEQESTRLLNGRFARSVGKIIF